MKIAKRLWSFFVVSLVAIMLCLTCFSADITEIIYYHDFNISREDSRTMIFANKARNPELNSKLNVNSYAVFSAIKDEEDLIGIDCLTYGENKNCDSVYDYMYMTVAYASLSVTFSSGESMFVEDIVKCNGDYSAVAELSSIVVWELPENAVVKDYESIHRVYSRLSKYPIEFDHGEAYIEKIVVEPYIPKSNRR